jgi:hypothetical protein
VDKEIILHIIDGPGATWGWIVFGLFAMITIITLVRQVNDYNKGVAAGREDERREGLDQIRAQMAKVMFDQQQLMKALTSE